MSRNFFRKLSRTLNTAYDDHIEELDQYDELTNSDELDEFIPEPANEEGQLSLDIYEKPDSFVVKAMTAGVRKEDLDITITRETLSIRGTREDRHAPDHSAYVFQELFWGTFSREVALPDEVDIDKAEATEEHGLLTIKLPKVDKYRATKLSVDSKK